MTKLLKVSRIAAAAVVVGTCLILTGSGFTEPVKHKKKQIELKNSQARALFASRHFDAGLQAFQNALTTAKSDGDLEWSIKLTSNIGGAYYFLYRYQEALQSYLSARDLATQAHLPTIAAVINVNLASLYILIGDLTAANQAAEDALHAAGNSELQGHRYQLLACLAELRAKQGRKNEAIAYFLQAALSADRAADTAFLARIWEHLGEFMLREGDYPAAEGPLLEAFRLCTLSHDRDIRVSYLDMAWLRTEQGDLRSGSALLSRAVAMPHTDAGAPPWFVSFLQGRLAEKQGDLKSASRSYSLAFEQAIQWQDEIGPSDNLRGVSFAREEFQRVYEALMGTSLTLGREQAVDAFAATEVYRAAALRQSLLNNRNSLKQMPPAYWSSLSRLRAAEIAELSRHSEANLTLISTLRQDLSELQSEHSPRDIKTGENYTSAITLRNIQASLGQDEALLSFYVGPGSTALWAITRQRIERYPLPGAPALDAMISQFRADVRNRRRSPVAYSLYQALFQHLDSDFLSRKTWIVSASEALFSLPFVALEVERSGARPVYLLERHVLLHTPSALMLTASASPASGSGFVGVGDGIYNSADLRWRSGTAPFHGWETAFRQTPAVELPRLPGSGQELIACASKWRGTELPVLLEGAAASSASLRTALRSHPAVLHLAAHVIAPSPGQPEESAIDLGIDRTGRPDVLTGDDIGALDASNTTVVMSGCSSAGAPAVSGKGVLGLTRAWLLAGARVVVGSRWPTPDDTGELFQSFYEHFRSTQDPDRTRAVARSLREAQLDMLHSGTWRASPWFWGAFYALGKE